MITFLFIQMVHGIEMLWLVQVFPIKHHNFHEIDLYFIASKYITNSLSCLQALHHMKLEHPLIGMVIQKWVTSHIGIRDNEKADFAAKSALDLPRPRLVYPVMILNQYILPLDKMIGMVRLRTSFILSSQSWEIGSPPKAVQEG